MASGIIKLTRTGYGEMFGQIVWSSTSNGTEANTSTVTATIQVSRTAPYVTTGTWTGNIKVGGTTKSFSVYHDVTSSWLTLQTVATTVSHNADGTGSCYISGTIQGPGGTSMEYTSTTGTEAVTLDTIPRQATLTSATNFNDEENPKITYTNPLGAAVPSLQVGISLDSTSDCDVAYRDVDKTAGTDTIDLTDAERDVLRAAVTDGNTRTVWIYLRTRIDETYYYSPLSKTLTIKDPEPNISPVINDTNEATIALTGNRNKLIKYYSRATVLIGASAVKGATIQSTKVVCGNKVLTSNGTFEGVESGLFVFTATDSRGNTATKDVSKLLVDYIKLTCNLANNMPDGEGNMAIKATGNCFNGSFGAKSNSLNVYYRYKPVGGSYSSWAAMTVTKSGNTYSATANLTGLDYQTAYQFQAYAVDALATVYSSEKTAKATPVFDWGENDFKFNVPVFDKFGALFGNGLAAYTGGGDSGIDPNTTLEGLCLTSHSNAPQGLGVFYYIHTAFYNTKSETAARAQFAIPYNKTGSMYHRYYASGVWSAWARYMNADEIYPVGSVCIRYDTTSPATLYGGTWQRIEGRVLFGCATSGTIGATGSHATGSGSSSLPYVNVAIWRRTA